MSVLLVTLRRLTFRPTVLDLLPIFSSIPFQHMDCLSGNLVSMVNTTVGVALAKDQPLTHAFFPSTEKLKSSLEFDESPHLSTPRPRSPSTLSSSSVSDEEVQQQNDHVAAIYANIDQTFSCIQQAYLNVQRGHDRRKVMRITHKKV